MTDSIQFEMERAMRDKLDSLFHHYFQGADTDIRDRVNSLFDMKGHAFEQVYKSAINGIYAGADLIATDYLVNELTEENVRDFCIKYMVDKGILDNTALGKSKRKKMTESDTIKHCMEDEMELGLGSIFYFYFEGADTDIEDRVNSLVEMKGRAFDKVYDSALDGIHNGADLIASERVDALTKEEVREFCIRYMADEGILFG